MSVSSQSITISDLPLLKSVAVTAKVVEVHQPEQVFNGKTKQGVQISDLTGAVNLILWEDDVGMLEQGISQVYWTAYTTMNVTSQCQKISNVR